MTIDQLDKLLSEWKAHIDTAALNVVELHNLPSYELFVASVGSPQAKLSGATEVHLGPAIFSAEEFVREFGYLSDTIQRAVALRDQFTMRHRFTGLDQKIDEIERILLGPSIAIPSGGSITPRQLLAQMNLAYRTAYDSLAEVDRVWQRLDQKLADVARFLQAHSSEPYLAPLRRDVEKLRARVISDPLGASADFDREIQPLFDKNRAAMEALVRQRASVRQDMLSAHELLAQLEEARTVAEVIYSEYKLTISGEAPPTPALPRERLAELAGWLGRLEAKLSEGQLDAVCIGLANWTAHVTELIAVEERTCRENQAPLAMRRELRGRLSALKAKASARGLAEDPQLCALAQRARTLLHVRPTPLHDAAALVAQFASRLNGQL